MTWTAAQTKARGARPKHWLVLVCLVAGLAAGCDPAHKRECEWVLMPDTDASRQVTEGHIPVCARNLTVNKEDCRLQTTLDFAKKVYGRKFRYVDLKVKNYGLPRTIDQIKFCK